MKQSIIYILISLFGINAMAQSAILNISEIDNYFTSCLESSFSYDQVTLSENEEGSILNIRLNSGYNRAIQKGSGLTAEKYSGAVSISVPVDKCVTSTLNQQMVTCETQKGNLIADLHSFPEDPIKLDIKGQITVTTSSISVSHIINNRVSSLKEMRANIHIKTEEGDSLSFTESVYCSR